MKYEILDRIWRAHCALRAGSPYEAMSWDTHLHMDKDDQVSHYGFMLHLNGYTFRTLVDFPPDTVTDAEIVMIAQAHFNKIINQVEELGYGLSGKQASAGFDPQVGGSLRDVPEGVCADKFGGDYGAAREAPDGENGIPI